MGRGARATPSTCTDGRRAITSEVEVAGYAKIRINFGGPQRESYLRTCADGWLKAARGQQWVRIGGHFGKKLDKP